MKRNEATQLVLIGAFFVALGCGPRRHIWHEPEEVCTVSQAQGGALIECSDGTQAFVPNGLAGQDGRDGMDGANGQDGADGQNGEDASLPTELCLKPAHGPIKCYEVIYEIRN